MPRKPERRQLPSGDEYFAFSGRIVNASDQTQTVPPIIVEMRDEQDRLVFGWTIRPPVKELGPGDQASFHESRIDIHKNARNLTLTFAERGASTSLSRRTQEKTTYLLFPTFRSPITFPSGNCLPDPAFPDRKTL